MSNGDDVLVDNWEEIDEADLTNTLQKIQAERKTQEKQQQIVSAKSSSSATSSSSLSAGHNNSFLLSNIDFPAPGALAPMKLLQRNANSADSTRSGQSATPSSPTSAALKSPLDDMAAAFQPVMMMLHKPADEYQSTTYAQPTHLQTVKILRRPTQSSEPRNNGIRPRQPIKTLQQREQEYAEARLRILGAAKNPEDDVGASNANSSSANATAAATAGSNATPTTNTNTAAALKGNAAPKIPPSSAVVGGGGSAQNLYNNYYNQQQQQQQQNYFFMQQQQQQPLPAFNNRTLAASMSPLLPPHTLQHQRQQSPPPPPPQHQTWSPVVGGSVSSPALRQQQQETVLRLPRGPDGSNGFQMRR